MAEKKYGSNIASLRLSQLLLYVGPLVTLVVNPWSNYDPISLPKMLVLLIFSFATFSVILSAGLFSHKSLPKYLVCLISLFVLGLFLSLLFSGAPISQQIWGSFGRNTGLLTYLSLTLIFVTLVVLRSHLLYSEMINYLMWTSFPMTFYCVIQYLDMDPFPWSERGVFGTLGNINFLSAFLGMTSVLLLIQSLNSKVSVFSRIIYSVKLLIDLFLITSTGSIQGPIIFIVGLSIFVLVYLAKLRRARNISLIAFLTILIVALYLTVSGLNNSGPFSKLLFQPSFLFRQDYWHAGLDMTMKKPFFGVGLDSYGDWYREVRGEVSTLRTGPGRVSNTAHNIFLDISSNGGLILGAAYLCLVLLTLLVGFKTVLFQKNLFTYQTMTFCVWIAYQVQSLVSINQIGIGIWGWILTGMVIGMHLLREEDAESTPPSVNSRNFRRQRIQFGARDSLALAMGGIVGFTLGIVPLQADAAYRNASSSGDIGKIRIAVMKLGATQFHRELALDFALKNNLAGETKTLAEELVRDYPRNYFGWRVLSVSTANTDQDRLIALNQARALDPYNPELK